MRSALLVALVLTVAATTSPHEMALGDDVIASRASLRTRTVRFAPTPQIFEIMDSSDLADQTETEDRIVPMYGEPFSSRSCWMTGSDIALSMAAIVYSTICLVGQYHAAHYLYGLYQYYFGGI